MLNLHFFDRHSNLVEHDSQSSFKHSFNALRLLYLGKQKFLKQCSFFPHWLEYRHSLHFLDAPPRRFPGPPCVGVSKPSSTRARNRETVKVNADLMVFYRKPYFLLGREIVLSQTEIRAVVII